MNGHVYKLKYAMETTPGKFDKKEFKEPGTGGTDALLMLSCIYPEDGSLSVQHWSIDGRTGKEMTSIELFKLWMMIGRSISEMEDLDEFRKALAAMPIDDFVRFTGMRDRDGAVASDTGEG